MATDSDEDATLGDIVLGPSTIEPENYGGCAFRDSVPSICIDLEHWFITSMILS